MEIKDMRAFYAVVEEGNISHAAQRLGMAQPALSRQMKKLEEALGVRLFERGSRRIRLTESGRVLQKRIEHILGLVDGTMREIADIGNGAAGAIRLGTITTSGAVVLPKLIAEFHRSYPKITFEIWEAEGARILELLDNRIIEIAITRTQVDTSVYESIVLPNEPMMIIMRRDDVCGRDADTVKLSELKDKPLIIPLRWQAAFVENCKNLGFEPNIVCVSDGIVQDLLFVKMGLGVAMLPVMSGGLLTDGSLLGKRLTEPEMTTHTVVSWLKNISLSAGSRAFLKSFRDMYVKNKKI